MIDKFFSTAQRKQITDAIAEAENATSGEIRLHIDQKCKEDVLDRAAFVFEELKMHQTEQRNGVLFYVSVEDHKLAILGDAGINKVVPEHFWEDIKDELIQNFKNENYACGLSDAIIKAGDQLKAHFPVKRNDVNELSDEISFGKPTK